MQTVTEGPRTSDTRTTVSFNRLRPPAKPQELLLAFLGALVLDEHPHPVPTSVFLDVLKACGIPAAATRSALTRLVERDLLVRRQVGRVADYGLTEASLRLLREGEARVRAPEPFRREGDQWTLLSFSVPEARRDARHRLRSRLLWAGFGCLRDGLWIAPGRVPLANVVGDDRDVEYTALDGFVAEPAPETDVPALIRRAWDLSDLRAEHDRFIERWGGPLPSDEQAVPQLTALTADWLHLLRADPVLPTAHLSEDWPAEQSAAVYKRVSGHVVPVARRAFAEALAAARSRR